MWSQRPPHRAPSIYLGLFFYVISLFISQHLFMLQRSFQDQVYHKSYVHFLTLEFSRDLSNRTSLKKKKKKVSLLLAIEYGYGTQTTALWDASVFKKEHVRRMNSNYSNVAIMIVLGQHPHLPKVSSQIKFGFLDCGKLGVEDEKMGQNGWEGRCLVQRVWTPWLSSNQRSEADSSAPSPTITHALMQTEVLFFNNKSLKLLVFLGGGALKIQKMI